MKISEIIAHLEKIKATDGDLDTYTDHPWFNPVNLTHFKVEYIREPKNKREVRKFWSEYIHKEDEKAQKVLRMY